MISAEQFRAIVSGQEKTVRARLLRLLLRAVEFPYTLVVGSRNRSYDRERREIHTVDAPVISVGNLTLGGTGKTPCVAWIARWFRERNIRVAIVSRGYRAEEGKPNDEAMELAQRLPDVPHLQNINRVEAASTAVDELDSQLVVLDDGFQHRRLHRDLDIVLIDALEPFGFDHVFPRGTLREPFSNVARADVVCISRCDQVSRETEAEIVRRIEKHAPHATICSLAHQPHNLLSSSGETSPLSQLHGEKIAAFCGIGNPAAFRQTLVSCGASIEQWKEFPDHHAYARDDVEQLIQWVTDERVSRVVCTQKDLVKLGIEQLGKVPLFALTIEMRVSEGIAELEDQLQLIADGIV